MLKATSRNHLSRRHQLQMHRACRLFGGWIVRPVEELSQRNCSRLDIDNTQTQVVLERRDAILIHDEAAVNDEPRRNGSKFWKKERVAH